MLDHATLNFSAPDILGFLGRHLHARFDGQVMTQCKKDRWPGTWVRHGVKNNWLKMYDKFGLILRVETVINNSREFRVRHLRTRGRQRRMTWCPMNKGVCNMSRYQQVSSAANDRYLDGLSVVNDPAYRQLKPLAACKIANQRCYAGFNPARREDVELFAAVLNSGNQIHGFRNADVRVALFGQPRHGSEASRVQTRRRQSSQVTRLLKRHHVRRLIVKVPRSRRWHITSAGKQLLSAVVTRYHRDFPQQLAEAA